MHSSIILFPPVRLFSLGFVPQVQVNKKSNEGKDSHIENSVGQHHKPGAAVELLTNTLVDDPGQAIGVQHPPDGYRCSERQRDNEQGKLVSGNPLTDELDQIV